MQRNGVLERIQEEYKGQKRTTPTNGNSFYLWLKGKRVIFIGPAAYYEEPETLDYDVVVRCNHGFESRARTDVLYVNNRFIKHEHALEMIDQAKQGNIQWVITKHPFGLRRLNLNHNSVKLIGMRDRFIRGVNKEFNMINRGTTTLNIGLLAVEHLRKAGLKSLVIRGVDFYGSGYYDGYSPYYEVMDEEALEKLQSKRTHDQDMHKRYFKQMILPDRRVDVDDALQEALKT